MLRYGDGESKFYEQFLYDTKKTKVKILIIEYYIF